MRFLYRYQKGGEELAGEISASSEMEAYSLLRKSGVRPMKVWPKPGLLNRLSAIGKRGLAIVILAIVATAAVLAAFREKGAADRSRTLVAAGGGVAVPLQRQQVSTNIDGRVLTEAFAHPCERTLAAFAQPGELGLLESVVSKDAIRPEVIEGFAQGLEEAIRLSDDDAPEVTLLKRIVATMKSEARLSVSLGETPATIIGRLVERQRMEASYRANAIRELRQLANCGTNELAAANQSIRLMGMREIRMEEL